MESLQLFNFEGQDVRVVLGEDGELWWSHKDACACLEIADARQAYERLDEDEKGWVDLPTPGGKQRTRAVNESGLYELAFASKKPAAKRFKRWVKREVLPSLRKTGRYAVPGAESPLPDFTTMDPKALALINRLSGKALAEGERADAAEAERDQAKSKVVELEGVVVEMEPKVAMAEAVVDDGESLDLDVAAEQLSNDPLIGRLTRKALIDWLLKKKWLYRRGKAHRLHVHRDAYDAGLMDNRFCEPWTDNEGNTRRSATPLLTTKGLALALRELRDERSAAKRQRQTSASQRRSIAPVAPRAVDVASEAAAAASQRRLTPDEMQAMLEQSDLLRKH